MEYYSVHLYLGNKVGVLGESFRGGSFREEGS